MAIFFRRGGKRLDGLEAIRIWRFDPAAFPLPWVFRADAPELPWLSLPASFCSCSAHPSFFAASGSASDHPLERVHLDFPFFGEPVWISRFSKELFSQIAEKLSETFGALLA
jgi:hypothetical protein